MSEIYGGKDPRDVAAYTVPYAARLVALAPSTLRNWVCGRSYPTKTGTRRAKPIIRAAPNGYLTFTNLVEAHVLAAMRTEYQLKLNVIRRAVKYVEEELQVENPLAREEFTTDGVDLFVERFGKLVNASREGQTAIREALAVRLSRIEYAAHRAERLFPMIRSGHEDQPKLIVVDPRRAFGRPVLDGTGIPVDVICERFMAGDSLKHLAKDYGVGVEYIEEAVRAA